MMLKSILSPFGDALNMEDLWSKHGLCTWGSNGCPSMHGYGMLYSR